MTNAPRLLRRPAHHSRIVVSHLTEGVHQVQPPRGDQVLCLGVVLCAKPRHSRLTVHDLAGQHLAIDLERPALFDQHLGLSHGDVVELGKFLHSPSLDKPAIRHDAEPLKMRRPVLSEIDILDVAAFGDGAIQHSVIQAQIFLLQFGLQLARQRPPKDLPRRIDHRKRSGSSDLLRLGKLHQVQRPGLFRPLPGWINQTGKQSSSEDATDLRIYIGSACSQQGGHRLKRDDVAFRQNLGMS